MNNVESLVNLSLFESIRQAHPDTFYLDHFVFLMLSLLSEKNQNQITTEEIQKLFLNQMQIDIPLVSINNISKRAVQKGYFKIFETKNNNQCKTYKIVNNKTKKQNQRFNSLKSQIKQSQEQLYLQLQSFINKKYQKTLTLDKCKILFHTHFLKKYKNIENLDRSENICIYNENYVINDFIVHLHKNNNNQLLKCLENIIRGNWVSNYLFMWKGDSYKKNLKGITVFLDTPLIISLLGFHGKLSKKVISELVKLLNALKAKTMVFSHNIEETQNVLKVWAQKIQSGRYNDIRIEVVQEIRNKQYDSQSLQNLAIGLKGFLNDQNISEEPDPKILNSYRIDEEALEQSIAHPDSNYIGDKVRMDIKSAIFIFALRQGRATLNVTDNPHIFVSSSYKVVRSVNDFFKENYPEQPKNISLFTMDNWLTNLCWISNPKTTRLPRDFLVANSYAALNADSEFWDIFKEKLKTIEKQGKITEEGLQEIRYERDFKYCVEEYFVSTQTQEINENNINEIIKKTKKRVYKNYEKKIQMLKKNNETTNQNLKNISNKLSHIITTVIGVLVFCVLILIMLWIHNYWIGIISMLFSFFGIRYKYQTMQKFFSKKIFQNLNPRNNVKSG